MNSVRKLTRRRLLQSAAIAVPTILSASALGRERAAPSDRINIGFIGFGARGQHLRRAAGNGSSLDHAGPLGLRLSPTGPRLALGR